MKQNPADVPTGYNRCLKTTEALLGIETGNIQAQAIHECGAGLKTTEALLGIETDYIVTDPNGNSTRLKTTEALLGIETRIKRIREASINIVSKLLKPF